jgi:hypothetical protein
MLNSLLLLLCLFGVTNAVFANPATQLVVNCTDGTIPPPNGHCFDEVVGKPFTFWVVAVDANGQLATNYSGTVHITSSDPTAALPPDHTFSIGDKGEAALPFTFNSVTTGNVPSPESIFAIDSENSLSGEGIFFVSLRVVIAPLNTISLVLLSMSLVLAGLHSWRLRVRT